MNSGLNVLPFHHTIPIKRSWYSNATILSSLECALYMHGVLSNVRGLRSYSYDGVTINYH
jgi:hypothetical protein